MGDNGKDFATESLVDNAFRYVTVQAMRVGERRDGLHYDGGASLLHMGVTLFGHRELTFHFLEGGRPHSLQISQRPGLVYVGNLCSAEHEVFHRKENFHLFHGSFPPATPPSVAPAASSEGCEIAVMVRTDVFRHSMARTTKSKPGPSDVFEIVNLLVRDHLAKEPLELPTFASCAIWNRRISMKRPPAA